MSKALQQERWLNPGVVGIGLASLLADMGHEIPTALLPSFLVATLGAPAAALGLIEGVANGAAGVARLLGGALADDPGRRRSVAAGGYVGTAVLAALIGVAATAWQAGVLRIAAWVSRGLRVPPRNALLAVVACSCSFALATPIAMLAPIGAAAKRGLLIKGGKYLELLDRADVLLIDKTGTLTLGRPKVTDIVALNGLSEEEVLSLVAAAERYSEHPLAEAVRTAARGRGLIPQAPEQFEAVPGLGVRAQINGNLVEVGNRRMLPAAVSFDGVDALEGQGKNPPVCDARRYTGRRDRGG